jgi:hypothetical protein
MPNTIIFGQGTSAAAYVYAATNPDDAGTPVLLRATSAVFAPNGWTGEALHRIASLIVSSTVGAACRVTPFLEGRALDGADGRPDSRVTFTIATPAAGERTQVKVKVGLFVPVRMAGVDTGNRTGLRGTWIQLLLETTGAIDIPEGAVPDLRFDGVEMQWEPLLGRQQVVNA